MGFDCQLLLWWQWRNLFFFHSSLSRSISIWRKMSSHKGVSKLWFIYLIKLITCKSKNKIAAAVAVGLERLPRKRKVGRSQPRQTYVVKAGSDSSTAKRSALGVSDTGPRGWPLSTDFPCNSRCGTLKNPHCSMVMSAEYRSKLAALHRPTREFVTHLETSPLPLQILTYAQHS